MRNNRWIVGTTALILSVLAFAFFWVNGWIWIGGPGIIIFIILTFVVATNSKNVEKTIKQLKGEASARKHTVSSATAKVLLQHASISESEWKLDSDIEAIIKKIGKLKSFQTCALTLYNKQSRLQWFKLAFTKSKGDNFILAMSGEGDLCVPILDELDRKVSDNEPPDRTAVPADQSA